MGLSLRETYSSMVYCPFWPFLSLFDLLWPFMTFDHPFVASKMAAKIRLSSPFWISGLFSSYFVHFRPSVRPWTGQVALFRPLFVSRNVLDVFWGSFSFIFWHFRTHFPTFSDIFETFHEKWSVIPFAKRVCWFRIRPKMAKNCDYVFYI